MIYSNKKAIKSNYNYYKHNKHNLPQDIYDAYNKPSHAKAITFNEWKRFVQKHEARGLRIISSNCHFYTLGFTFIEDGEEYFAYITAYNNYCCKVKELEELC